MLGNYEILYAVIVPLNRPGHYILMAKYDRILSSKKRICQDELITLNLSVPLLEVSVPYKRRLVSIMREKALVGGAVAAGFLASLCCVGPLLFVLLGLGAFGIGTFLDSTRPFLMSASVLMLGIAFYRTYIRRTEVCEPDGTCVRKPVSRASRVVLWIASIAVLAFAALPYVAGPLVAKFNETKTVNEQNSQNASRLADNTAATSANGPQVAAFTVEGMTCVSCETTIRLALKRSPGVLHADVSYAKGAVRVEYNPQETTPDKLRDAINKTGYKATENK